MPARVANGSSSSSSISSSSDSCQSPESETNIPHHFEKSSSTNVELTARRVANTTSEAVRTLASRTEAPGLTSTDAVSLQEAHFLSNDSPAAVDETIALSDLAGLQKVIVTAERVAASTGGAVLKLGSSFHHQ